MKDLYFFKENANLINNKCFPFDNSKNRKIFCKENECISVNESKDSNCNEESLLSKDLTKEEKLKATCVLEMQVQEPNINLIAKNAEKDSLQINTSLKDEINSDTTNISNDQNNKRKEESNETTANIKIQELIQEVDVP